MPSGENEVRFTQRVARMSAAICGAGANPKIPDIASLIRATVLCPAFGTAIDELCEEACDLSRPLQVRQMSSAGQHMARPVRHRRCHMTASFLNVREIEVTPDHERWRRYLAETMEGGRDIEVRPGRRRP